VLVLRLTGAELYLHASGVDHGEKFHKPPYRVELQVKVTGIKDGKPAQLQTGIAYLDGY
jgi:hypothetical protein